ncbi:hypothetical protein ACET3Z_000769 [Daucus carota]
MERQRQNDVVLLPRDFLVPSPLLVRNYLDVTVLFFHRLLPVNRSASMVSSHLSGDLSGNLPDFLAGKTPCPCFSSLRVLLNRAGYGSY